MKSACFRFFLLTAFVVTVGGCGSNGSPSSASTDNGTGSLAAKLIWSPPGAKTTAKTLYAAPAGVLEIQIIVSAADMQDTVSARFPATAGTGTLHGIPAGPGRIVTARGLDATGVIRYQGVASNVTIVTGQTTPLPITMSAPVTTASPAGGLHNPTVTVTLTATNQPATIYYTTNGIDPTTSDTHGLNQITGIQMLTTTTLKFFAIDSGFAEEPIKTETYTVAP